MSAREVQEWMAFDRLEEEDRERARPRGVPKPVVAAADDDEDDA